MESSLQTAPSTASTSQVSVPIVSPHEAAKLSHDPTPTCRLVIACPTQRRFTVVLSDWLRNTTLSEITNDDTDSGTIRILSVSNVQVTHVRRSHEYYDPMYRDSTIVVTKNSTAAAGSGQYSVTRFWRNPFTRSIES